MVVMSNGKRRFHLLPVVIMGCYLLLVRMRIERVVAIDGRFCTERAREVCRKARVQSLDYIEGANRLLAVP